MTITARTKRRGLAVAALLLAAPVAAQNQVLVVDDDGGPGVDHTDLQAAIDAAADGDFLLLKDGVYPAPPGGALTIDQRDLTILADRGHVAHVGSLTVTGLLPWQQVSLRGLEFPGARLRLLTNEGAVWVEECVFPGLEPLFEYLPTVEIDRCESTVFTRCDATGSPAFFLLPLTPPGRAIDARDSNVFLYDGTFRGGGGSLGGSGADAVALEKGLLFASNCTFLGGDATSGGCGTSGAGLRVTGTAILGTDAESHSLGCLFASGAVDEVCGVKPEAVVVGPAATHEEVAGASRGCEASRVTRVGTETKFEFWGAPGDLILFDFAAAAGGFYYAPLNGAYVLEFPPLDLVVLALVPAGGYFTFDFPMTTLGPTASGAALYLQANFYTPGVGFTLSSPTMMTILEDV
jgi:hypothetical protein